MGPKIEFIFCSEPGVLLFSKVTEKMLVMLNDNEASIRRHACQIAIVD
jgi:hypothetical protein